MWLQTAFWTSGNGLQAVMLMTITGNPMARWSFWLPFEATWKKGTLTKQAAELARQTSYEVFSTKCGEVTASK